MGSFVGGFLGNLIGPGSVFRLERAGIIGSIIGNMIAGPLLGISGSVQEYSILGLGVAVLGAVVLLGIVNLIQRGRVR